MADVTLDPLSARTTQAKAVTRKGRGLWAELGDEGRLEKNLPVIKKVCTLGEGAFGRAYLVSSRGGRSGSETDVQQLVLKRIALKGCAEDRRDGAIREALLMRRISGGCPYITQFHDVLVGEGGLTMCLIMEYCSGGDLRQVLQDRRGNRLPEDYVLIWAAQVGLALRHCHSHGVLHRDVKPENCFFRQANGDLVLGDFGVSCALDEKSFAKTCIGSPQYLSPEIVNQDPYTFSCDVWSLGVLLYEMAMLQPPFRGLNICQLALRIVSSDPEPLDTTFFSVELQHLVARLLLKDANLRASLDEALLLPPLNTAVARVCASAGIEWPPRVTAGSSMGFATRRGLVERMRALPTHDGNSLSPPGGNALTIPTHAYEGGDDEYADDFETLTPMGKNCGLDDEALYDQDTFEEYRSDGEASYEQDFENASDGEDEERLHGEDAQRQLLVALGPEGMMVAQNLGVVHFLEGMQGWQRARQ